jgi:hypothetical protein
MMRTSTCRPARQQGQALTEFVVIALALVPLFLLMPMIGKYQDLAHSTEMASRYVAFDAIANNENSVGGFKQPAQLAAEVRRRFFSNTDAPIKTGDEAGDFNANRNLMWSDPQGDPLIQKFGDVTVSFGTGHGAANQDGVSDASDDKPFNPLPVYKPAEIMGLKTGIYTANVHVKLANVQKLLGNYAKSYEELGALNLTITRSTTLLVNTWTSGDASMTNSRIAKVELFPGLLLKPAQAVVDPAVSIMEFPACFSAGGCHNKGPKLGELDYFNDVVPADRKQ